MVKINIEMDYNQKLENKCEALLNLILGIQSFYYKSNDDKKKFIAEIEGLIKDQGIYWYADEDGEVGINAKNINSVEFAEEQDKREAGLV